MLCSFIQKWKPAYYQAKQAFYDGFVCPGYSRQTVVTYSEYIDSDIYNSGVNESIVQEKFYQIIYPDLILCNLMHIHIAMI